MRAAPLHLEAGSDVRLTLEQFARQSNATGFVLSVVGNLSRAAFACPDRPAATIISGELEIITLQGTISPNGVHLHLSFSDTDCQVWGGHLEPGTLVLRGADLLVGLLEEAARPATGPRVKIAVLPGCPYSIRALRMLRTLAIPYLEIPPDGAGPVPQLFID
ncbi:MAG: DUF296 domain-containing protein, partial [Cyanobacteria bacterium]|nr:DUF296 domain-containing protein [Cyanobacteria bacterium bin.275]